jgi:hypothetical protein
MWARWGLVIELPVIHRSGNSEAMPTGLVGLGTLIILRLVRDSSC